MSDYFFGTSCEKVWLTAFIALQAHLATEARCSSEFNPNTVTNLDRTMPRMLAYSDDSANSFMPADQVRLRIYWCLSLLDYSVWLVR